MQWWEQHGTRGETVLVFIPPLPSSWWSSTRCLASLSLSLLLLSNVLLLISNTLATEDEKSSIGDHSVYLPPFPKRQFATWKVSLN